MPGLSTRRIAAIGNVGAKFQYLSKEDAEGLLVNLGVVAALILSFAIGLFFTIPRDELVQHLFVDQLMVEEGFRSFVADRLDNELSEFEAVYGRSNAPCVDCEQCSDKAYGVCGNLFSVTNVLRETYTKKCTGFEYGGTFSGDKVGSFTQTFECRRFWSAARILLSTPDFPYEHLLVVYYGDRSLEGEKTLCLPAFLSSTFLSTALLGSLCLYCSLVVSYGRGQGTGGCEQRRENAFNRWLTFFFPVLCILYVLLLVGTVFAYWGIVRVVRIRMVAQDEHMFMYVNLALIFPFLFGGFALYTMAVTTFIYRTAADTADEEPESLSDQQPVLPNQQEQQQHSTPAHSRDIHAGQQSVGSGSGSSNVEHGDSQRLTAAQDQQTVPHTLSYAVT